MYKQFLYKIQKLKFAIWFILANPGENGVKQGWETDELEECSELVWCHFEVIWRSISTQNTLILFILMNPWWKRGKTGVRNGWAQGVLGTSLVSFVGQSKVIHLSKYLNFVYFCKFVVKRWVKTGLRNRWAWGVLGVCCRSRVFSRPINSKNALNFFILLNLG